MRIFRVNLSTILIIIGLFDKIYPSDSFKNPETDDSLKNDLSIFHDENNIDNLKNINTQEDSLINEQKMILS